MCATRHAGRLALAGCLLVSGLGCVGGATAPATAPSGQGVLTVRVEGVVSTRGSLALALFADAASFETRGDPVMAERLPAAAAGSGWRIPSLPFGTYAVKVYQDIDDSGELGRSSLGVPAEPYGFSNDARGALGPPDFAAAAFEHATSETTIVIELR